MNNRVRTSETQKIFFTPEETAVAASVKASIDAKFGHSRLAMGDECRAYICTPLKNYVYDVLKNGHWERGGEFPFNTPIETDGDAAVSRSIEAIDKAFPDAKNQQLVWRLEPEFRILKASPAMKKFEIPAYPARVELYLRFTVTPLGVTGLKKA